MNVMLALTALGLLLGAFSYRWYRMTPTLANRLTMLALGLAGAIAILVGQLTWNHFDIAHELAQVEQQRIRTRAAADEALTMSQVLGGPQGYIEYLKAKGAP